MNYSPDWNVASELENLSRVINESIEKAEKVLKEAKEIDETKKLIEEIQTTRTSLERTRSFIVEIQENINENLVTINNIDKNLNPLKNIHEELQALDIEKKLKSFRQILNSIEKKKKEIYEAESKVINLNEQADSFFEKINDISIKYEETLTNANVISDKIQSHSNDLTVIEQRLKPLKNLPEELEELGVDRDFLRKVQEVLISVQEIRQEIYKAEQKVISLNQKTDSFSIIISNDCKKYEEKTRNAQIVLNRLESVLISIKTNEERLKILITLSEEIKTLDIDNKLKNITEILTLIQRNKEEFYEAEQKVIDFNENAHNLSKKITDNAKDYEEKVNDVKIIPVEIKSILIDIKAIEERLLPLKSLPQDLHMLGINNDFLKNIQESLILIEKNKEETYESEKRAIKLNDETNNLSLKIDNGIEELKKIVDIYESKTINAKSILNQLRSILIETETMNEVRSLLNELNTARFQLNKSKEELAAVRKFDAYLQEYQMRSSRKNFKEWLWKELGIVGIIVYFLSIIIPKNVRNKQNSNLK